MNINTVTQGRTRAKERAEKKKNIYMMMIIPSVLKTNVLNEKISDLWKGYKKAVQLSWAKKRIIYCMIHFFFFFSLSLKGICRNFALYLSTKHINLRTCQSMNTST